jgi:hypothetical protein
LKNETFFKDNVKVWAWLQTIVCNVKIAGQQAEWERQETGPPAVKPKKQLPGGRREDEERD